MSGGRCAGAGLLDARTQAPSLAVGPHFGPDSPRPQPRLSAAPGSPSSSGEETALEEWRRACAQAPGRKPISDTLATEPLEDDAGTQAPSLVVGPQADGIYLGSQ